MNYRNVFRQLGTLLLVLSAVLCLIALIDLVVTIAAPADAGRAHVWALLLSALVGLISGVILRATLVPASTYLGRREALLLVTLSWVVGAGLSALPYWLWALLGRHEPGHVFTSFINCYFESMSGLTTTGATVLDDIESMPRSLLMWRALTHWLGGLGIVVLFVAVLPSLGVGGKRLFRVEAPGPAPKGLQPQVRETARVLLYLYGGMTLVQWVGLMLAGLDWFDALCHTFATLATGGFSTMNASAGAYGTAARLIMIVFMVLAGVNFGLYYQLIRGRFRLVLRDTELRFYLLIMLVGSTVVLLSILNQTLVSTSGELVVNRAVLLEEAVFTTASIQTTTGFCTSDFDRWPFLAKAVLVVLMLVGGSAGSTSGGIKVIRIWIMFKVMLAEIEKVFRPNVIRPVKMAGGVIDDELKLATLAYVLGIIVLFAAGAGALMLIEHAHGNEGCTFTTAATSSIATLCTIGPGLDAVGPVRNYGWYSGTAKGVMCVLMLLGRLEVMAIIVLFTPRFWKAD